MFVILYDEDMRKGDFVREIVRRFGFETCGMRIREVLDLAVEGIIQVENPFLMFDEDDKLNDNVFHYFIDLHNQLEDKYGITFLSTDYTQHRIDCGLSHSRKGYNKVYSRIKRKFFELKLTSCSDMFAICQANDLTDKKQITKMIDLTGKSEFGLRYVRDTVHQEEKVATAK